MTIGGDQCASANYVNDAEDIPDTTTQDPENPLDECTSDECPSPQPDKGWATAVIFNGIPSADTERPETFADGTSGDIEVGIGLENTYMARMRPQIQTHDGGCELRELYGKLKITRAQSAGGGAVDLLYNGTLITQYPFISPTLFIANHVVGDECVDHTWHYMHKYLEIAGVTPSLTDNDVVITVELLPNTPGAGPDPLHKQLIRCTVGGFKRNKSAVFLKAEDPEENESWDLPDLEQKLTEMEPLAAEPRVELEKWLAVESSVWTGDFFEDVPGIPLHASDYLPAAGGAKYRLKRESSPSGSTPVVGAAIGRFDGDSTDCTESTATESCDELVGDRSGPFKPNFLSGTKPGKYEIDIEMQEQLSGPWNPMNALGGELFVGRLDAHGPGSSSDSPFPPFTEVIPKRAGTVTAPVIAVLSGGVVVPDAAAPMSFYGTDSGDKNVWVLKAIAGGGAGTDPQVIPEGYSVSWNLDGGSPQPPSTPLDTQQITVKFEAGGAGARRFQPRLEILDDSGDVVGFAEIHDIVVERRPTNHVGTPSGFVTDWFGSTFALEYEAASESPPVDVLCRVEKSAAPESIENLDARGRIAPDGYPQNQYWGGASDEYDLAQAVTVGASSSVNLRVQGYQIESTAANDLQLEFYAQAQRESSYPNAEDENEDALKQYEFYEFAGGLDDVPPEEDRFRVVVSWDKVETETITSCYPIQMAYAYPESDLNPPELEPGVDLVIPADHLAYSNQPNVDTQSNYKVIDGVPGTVNLRAYIDWPGVEISDQYNLSEDNERLSLMWHLTSFSGNQCVSPKVWDINNQILIAGAEDFLHAEVDRLSSEVHIDYKKEIVAGVAGIGRAKAGDRFWVAVHSRFVDPLQMQEYEQTDRKFWHDLTLTIEHGVYRVHVTQGDASVSDVGVVTEQPGGCLPSDFDPHSEFDVTVSPEARYGEGACVWTSPTGSKEKKKLEVYFFDQFLNPIPDLNVNWSLSGKGRVSVGEPSNDWPDADSASVENSSVSTVTDMEGRAEIWYQMEGYPSCEWHEQGEKFPAFITCNAHGLTAPAFEPWVEVPEIRVPIPPIIELNVETTSPDHSRVFVDGNVVESDGPHDLDINSANDYVRLVFEVTANVTSFVDNYPVQLKTLNGFLKPISGTWVQFPDGEEAVGVLKTDSQGKIEVRLYPDDPNDPNDKLQLTEKESGLPVVFFSPIEVSAIIDDRVVRVSTEHVTEDSSPGTGTIVQPHYEYIKARWIDGSAADQTKIRIENTLLAHDLAPGLANELVDIETLFDADDALAMGYGLVEGLDEEGRETNFLAMPVTNRTLVEITGAAGKELRVDLGRPAGPGTRKWHNLDGAGPQLNFDFDEIDGTLLTTPSDSSIPLGETTEATVGAGVTLVEDGGHSPHRNSFEFDGTPTAIVTIPGDSSVIDPTSSAYGSSLEISLWLNVPSNQLGGMLVERAGQYEIELLSTGHVRATVGAAQVDTQQPIEPGWNFVQVRMSTKRLKIGLGSGPRSMDSNFPRATKWLAHFSGTVLDKCRRRHRGRRALGGAR